MLGFIGPSTFGVHHHRFTSLLKPGYLTYAWTNGLHILFPLEHERLWKVRSSVFNVQTPDITKEVGLVLRARAVSHGLRTELFRVCTNKDHQMLGTDIKWYQAKREVPKYLEMLQSTVYEGIINDDDVGSANEAHFIVSMTNNRTMGFIGESEVQFAKLAWRFWNDYGCEAEW